MIDFLSLLAHNIAYFLILPVLVAWFISFLSGTLTNWLTIHTSYTTTAVLSFFGVVTHEISHLIVAMIFRHHVIGFRLWQISDNRVLGYVNREYNPHSFYQRLGNTFISVAPVVGISSVIWLLIEFVWSPDSYIKNLIVAVIIGSLLLGFNLSATDWRNFGRGVPLYIIVILVVTILQYIL